jgi:hypothetical protein
MLPPARLQSAILDRVRASQPQKRPALAASFASVLLITLAFAIIFWRAFQPGVVLEWSVTGASPDSFRVYRTPASSSDWQLLSEVPAAAASQYRYVDACLLPWQAYTYTVEGVSVGGATVSSQFVQAQAIQALPGQAALIFLSFAIASALFVLIQRLPALRVGKRRQEIA